MTRASRGFTLMELLVTMAIIAILVAIAYPAYENQIMKSRRTDAETALTTLGNQEALFFAQNNHFTGTIVGLPGLNDASLLSPHAYYQLGVVPSSVNGGSSNAYLATATPTPGGPQAGDGSFTLSNTGAKTFVLNGTTQPSWPAA